jgi:hypothetical protein
VLDKNRAPHLPHFLQFLESCSHQRITLDQWDSFLQFNHAVNADLSNLEEDGACKTAACCDHAFLGMLSTGYSCGDNYLLRMLTHSM